MVQKRSSRSGAQRCYRVGSQQREHWILSIVHNRAFDQIRSHAKRGRMQDKVEASAPRPSPARPARDLEKTLSKRVCAKP